VDNILGTGDDENGIEGVIVELYKIDGTTLLATTVTDDNGRYYFGNLADNNQTYYVKITNAANFTVAGALNGLTYSAEPALPLNDVSGPVLLTQTASGRINLDQDFGLKASGTVGSIGDLVLNDVDADGFKGAGETGIAGVTVDLDRDLNGDGKVHPGEPMIGTATTDANGAYSLSGLSTTDNGLGAAGADYIVDVTDVNGVLNGYRHSLGTAGSDDNSQTDPYPVSISNGSPNNLTADFGYYVKPAALGNFVWNDLNNNGIQDSGEPGITLDKQGNPVKVTLTITWPGTTVVKTVITTLTDASGNYYFGNLLLDENMTSGGGGSQPSFSLTVTRPLGYQPGIEGAGSNPAIDSNPHSNAPATTTKGSMNATYDFDYIDNPTAVLLDNFQAVAQPDHVLVTWETVSEVSNGGFNLYRASAVDGERTLLTNVPSQSPGGTAGAAYNYQDYDVQPGQTYWYYLEDVDLSGRATLHEPVSVEFPWATAVALRTLGATTGSGLALWLVALAGLALLAAVMALVLRRRMTS
jgi:hypothetical protein